MIESRWLYRILEQRVRQVERQTKQTDILVLLEHRFKTVPGNPAERISAVEDELRLNDLLHVAVDCSDLEAFRVHLAEDFLHA